MSGVKHVHKETASMLRRIVFAAFILLACGDRPPSGAQRDVLPERTASAADSSEDLLFALHGRIEQRAAQVGYAGLTLAERTFHCMWWLEAEVNNGGFDQYFFNSAGDNSEDTVAALERIGAHRVAGILKRAMALFPSGAPSRDRYTRQDQLEALGHDRREQFDALDEEFYKYPDNLSELLGRYAKAHEQDFASPH